ncbi:MAG: hypothetical protein JWP92_1845 [Caulobacter sp.]|nr:hypothetical protein [Caulobacter sp.]
MTAIACLRILAAGSGPSPGPAVTPEQAKAAADAYLTVCWPAPKRFGAVAPYAFVLADPHAEVLDPVEMQGMAADIQASLFVDEPGQVCLMSFEGGEAAVLEFAALSQQALADVVAGGGGYAGPAGRIHVMTPDTVSNLAPPPGDPTGKPILQPGVAPAVVAAVASAPPPVVDKVAKPAAKAPEPIPIVKPAAKAPPPPGPAARMPPKAAPPRPPPPPPPPPKTGWWGVYHPPSEAFVGSVIGLLRDLTEPRPEDDAALLTRDLTCLNEAQSALASAPDGVLFVPFSFWNLTTPSAIEAYKVRLSRYPQALRERLGASVYDTPREASLGLLSQIKTFLQSSFAFVDLTVSTPSFPISGLPPDLVSSVTLALTGEDEGERIAAINQFIGARGAYRAKNFRQAVSGVTSSRELEACLKVGARFIIGPAVTGMSPGPIAAMSLPLVDLPLTSS